MGVSMLPRLAAVVSSATTQAIRRGDEPCSTTSVSGTKAIRHTSFVRSIAQKKHSRTNSSETVRACRARRRTWREIQESSPLFRKPATTHIRQKSVASTL